MTLAAPLMGPATPSALERAWGALPTPATYAIIAGGALLLLAWVVGVEARYFLRRGRARTLFGALEWLFWGGAATLVLLVPGPRELQLALYSPAFLTLLLLRWAAGKLLMDPVGRKRLLWVVTGVSLASFIGLTFWSTTLEAERSGVFVLGDQIVRIGAAVSGTVFVVCVAIHLMPRVLNLLEGRGFVQFVAARHVRSGKSNFLTAISVLSILGVALSSFALCIVISVMTGFGADLKRKILGNNAHVRIEAVSTKGFEGWQQTLDVVRGQPGVLAASPIAAGEVMASSSTNTAGVVLRGVDLPSIPEVIDLAANIQVGRLEYLGDERQLADLPADEIIWIAPGGQRYLKGKPSRYLPNTLEPEERGAPPAPDTLPGIVLGRELAKSLHVYVGDVLTLVSPLGDLGPMGVMPRSRRFRVAAIFYSGMYEYDASYAYAKLEVAQQFLDLGKRASAIDVKVTDAEAAPQVREALTSRLDPKQVRVRDWQEMNRQLFSALKLEKIATFIILLVAIIVASFCIICTLLLMVTEKSKEIAILKSLGASDRAVLSIFMTEGIVIGAIGTVFGVVTGLSAALSIKYFGVRLDPDVYYVDRLPINVDLGDFFMVALCSMIITTLATVYPALAASRLRPVEGIRYE
jgi:lipoprotein-releasing system permease protein